MKHLKLLVAAITALGLMAFGGASTASATTLFTDSAHTIDYPAGTTLHLTQVSGTTTVETDTSGNTISTCSNSTIHATTLNTTGTWIAATIDSFTWEGCSQTTDTTAKGSLELMWTSGGSAEVVGKGTKWTSTLFGVSCTYGFGEGTKLGTVGGGSAPVLKINASIPKIEGGFLCPSTEIIHGEYVFTSPHAVFVTS